MPTPNSNPSSLGGGIPGGQPLGGLIGGGGGSHGGSGMVGSSVRGQNRKRLRIGWGRFGEKHNGSITPFRQAFNAGDKDGHLNERATSGEANHLNGPGPANVRRIFNRAGGTKTGGDASYAGNPKHVYDGADYVKFKKLAAINATYNDKSFGGDDHNATFTSLMARH